MWRYFLICKRLFPFETRPRIGPWHLSALIPNPPAKCELKPGGRQEKGQKPKKRICQRTHSLCMCYLFIRGACHYLTFVYYSDDTVVNSGGNNIAIRGREPISGVDRSCKLDNRLWHLGRRRFACQGRQKTGNTEHDPYSLNIISTITI